MLLLRLILLTPCFGGEIFASGFDLALRVSDQRLLSVSYEQLEEFSAYKTPIPLSRLEITQYGKPIPFWAIENTPHNQELTHGERLVILPTQRKKFHHGFLEELAPIRIRLTESETEGLGIIHRIHPISDTEKLQPSRLERKVRWEKDAIRMAFPGSDFQSVERFYWRKLSSLDKNAWAVPEAIPSESNTVDITVSVRGATTLLDREPNFPEHALHLSCGNQQFTASWDGPYEKELKFTEVPFVAGDSITLHAPQRTTSAGNFVADVVFLNWIEIRFTQTKSLDARDAPFSFHPEKNDAPNFPISVAESGFLFCDSGISFAWEQAGQYLIEKADGKSYVYTTCDFETSDAEIRHWRTFDQNLLQTNNAHGLIITPEALEPFLGPLLHEHSENGKVLHVFKAEDIYDQFGFGQASPKAIQRAIREWAEQRNSDDTGSILLIGDASPAPVGIGRNLLPTWTEQIMNTLCASDNPYACLDDKSFLPDLAVGRIPAASAEELKNFISKQLSANGVAQSHPIRALWVVDEDEKNQSFANTIINEVADEEILIQKIFGSDNKSDESAVTRLKNTLGTKADWLFYYGHGARHVWQLGPPDYSNQSTLFTSDNLSQLASQKNHKPLRAVFALTCDNAPFDHTSDDSLGERFLMLPSGGAIAFIGASWRIQNEPELLRQYAKAASVEETIGDTFIKAKRQTQKNRRAATAFNLLGDPMLRLR